jgi:hypothetical protein
MFATENGTLHLEESLESIVMISRHFLQLQTGGNRYLLTRAHTARGSSVLILAASLTVAKCSLILCDIYEYQHQCAEFMLYCAHLG